MLRPLLFEKEGKPVAEWQLSSGELSARINAATLDADGFSGTLRLRALPRIPRQELLVMPVKIPAKYYLAPWPFYCKIVCPPRYRVRKNQKNLTAVNESRVLAVGWHAPALSVLRVERCVGGIRNVRRNHPIWNVGHALIYRH